MEWFQECTSCTHNLLDVTDALSQMINPVAQEFEAAALSYFTRQKLASLNQITSGLMEGVQQLELYSVPLESIELEGLMRVLNILKIKASYVEEESATRTANLMEIAQNVSQMEHYLKETSQNSHYVVDEVFLLSESLEGGSGPHIEKALDEAYFILQEIQSIEFSSQRDQSDQEMKAATELLANMKENALPVKDNHDLIANLTMRLQDFISRVIDLNRFIAALDSNQIH